MVSILFSIGWLRLTRWVGQPCWTLPVSETLNRLREDSPAGTGAVATHGLTHIALAVRDPTRSFEFYRAVLGLVAVYQSDDFVQGQTPETRDVLVFERNADIAGRRGGVTHFGFRLRRAEDISQAVAAVQAAGGTIREQGEFIPGEPYVFFNDLDGYEVEIWYELPTRADPEE